MVFKQNKISKNKLGKTKKEAEYKESEIGCNFYQSHLLTFNSKLQKIHHHLPPLLVSGPNRTSKCKLIQWLKPSENR